MESPYLIATTGYPSAGKSELVNYLTTEHKFARISTDQFRDIFYDQDFMKLKNDPEGEIKESTLWEILQYSKLNFLNKGLDVIIDSTAPNNNMREYLLSTQVSQSQNIPADKYLAWVDANKETLIQKNLNKGRTNDVVGQWDSYWEAPKNSPDYNILKYENNTPEQKEEMFKSLDQKFSKKGKIYRLHK